MVFVSIQSVPRYTNLDSPFLPPLGCPLYPAIDCGYIPDHECPGLRSALIPCSDQSHGHIDPERIESPGSTLRPVPALRLLQLRTHGKRRPTVNSRRWNRTATPCRFAAVSLFRSRWDEAS